MKAYEYFYYAGIEMQASKRIYKRFGMKRNELAILVSLSAYMISRNKQILSREIFCDWLGTGFQMQNKVWYHLRNLVEHGCLHRLAYRRPDGNSLAISVHGQRILQAFADELTLIAKQDKVKKLTFDNLQIDLNNLPKGYILKQAGRS